MHMRPLPGGPDIALMQAGQLEKLAAIGRVHTNIDLVAVPRDGQRDDRPHRPKRPDLAKHVRQVGDGSVGDVENHVPDLKVGPMGRGAFGQSAAR